MCKKPSSKTSKVQPRIGAGVSVERLLEVRLRIAAGFYDRPGVRVVTAQRILDAGGVHADL